MNETSDAYAPRPFTFLLSNDLRKRAERLAEADGRNLGSLVRFALKNYVENMEINLREAQKAKTKK